MNPESGELAIRALVARYADAVNRHDEELWASTWASDGVWDLAGMVVEGRDSVVELWRNAMGGFEFAIQLVYQGTIEINGNTATGRWYLTETLRAQGSETDRTSIGCYVDEYVIEDNAWCFARRSYRVMYDREGEQGNFNPLPKDH